MWHLVNRLKCILLLALLYIISFSSFAAFVDKGLVGEKGRSGFTIVVKYKEAKASDTLSLVLINPIFQNIEVYNKGWYNATAVNGCFTFHVSSDDKFGYFALMKSRTFSYNGGSNRKMFLIYRQFWEKNDSLTIGISNRETYAGVYSKCSFKGKGANKYALRDSVFSIIHSDELTSRNFNDICSNYGLHGISKQRLSLLEENKDKITFNAYQALKMDILYSINFRPIQKVFEKMQDSSQNVRKDFIKKYTLFSNNLMRQTVPEQILEHSPIYIRFVYNKILTDSYIYRNTLDTDWIYRTIKKTTNGLTREQVILMLFMSPQRPLNIKEMITDAKGYFKDSCCIQLLTKIDESEKGEKISDGEFTNTDGKTVRLSDFKGKAVLLDFWFNGCGACMGVYKELISKATEYFNEEPNFVILSINIDRTREKWLKGIETGMYTDSNERNLFTNGLGFTHPFIMKNNIPFCPWLILVDRNGVIVSVDGEELFKWDSLKASIQSIL